MNFNCAVVVVTLAGLLVQAFAVFDVLQCKKQPGGKQSKHQPIQPSDGAPNQTTKSPKVPPLLYPQVW